MCPRLHSWGRLGAPPGVSTDTPTQKHPGNGLPPAPPILGGQRHSCSQWGSEPPFQVPPSGSKWLEGSWATGEGTLSLGPQTCHDSRQM